MENKKIRYNGSFRWLNLNARINNRCEFIDIVIDDGDYVIVKVLRFRDYQENYEFNEHYNIIAFSPMREGKEHNFTEKTFMKCHATKVYTIYGDEYITYGGGGRYIPFVSIDENGIVSINEYFDEFDMIDTINKNIHDNY